MGDLTDEQGSITSVVRRWRAAAESAADGAFAGQALDVAVVADVHGSLSALGEVLADAERRGAREVWCLGDVVGRGPFARECIELLGDLGPQVVTMWLMGNHEGAWLGLPCCPLARLHAAEQEVLTRHHAPHLRALRGLQGPRRPGWRSWDWAQETLRRPVPDGP